MSAVENRVHCASLDHVHRACMAKARESYFSCLCCFSESSSCAYSRVAVVVIHPGTHWLAKAKHVVAKAKVPNSSEFYINVCSRKLAKADLKHFSRESYVARGESVAEARA